MKLWSCAVLALLLLSSACVDTSRGRFPNPKWKPKVEERAIGVRPASFVEGGLRLEVERLTEVDATVFGLLRTVKERWLYYDLEATVSFADPPARMIRKQDIEQRLAFRVLDEHGGELQLSHESGLTADERRDDVTRLRVYVRLKFVNRRPPRTPWVLMAGERALPLRE